MLRLLGELGKSRDELGGELRLHVVKHVAETAVVLGPVVFTNEASDGRTTPVLAYRVVSLDDMRVGYAKSISEVLLRAPSRPWLPARVEPWRAPGTAQEFAEQMQREGRCFLRTVELIDIARRLGLALPDTRHETIVRVICAWAAEACLEHVRSQLRGFVLYAIVPSSAAHTKRFKIPEAFLSKASKRKGEVCGRINCKRHRPAADDCSTIAPNSSGSSSPASACGHGQGFPAE